LDPLDASFLGISLGGKTYLGNALPFGWRHGSGACQQVTDAVRYIYKKHDITVVNYIDDFIGVAPIHDAHRAFYMTKKILADIGLPISEDKTVPPVSECVCLGIVINTNNLTLSIPKEKLNNIINICRAFSKFKKITKQQIKSILSSLIYINKAISSARLFVNRIITDSSAFSKLLLSMDLYMWG
jgi:hypothetical protein